MSFINLALSKWLRSESNLEAPIFLAKKGWKLENIIGDDFVGMNRVCVTIFQPSQVLDHDDWSTGGPLPHCFEAQVQPLQELKTLMSYNLDEQKQPIHLFYIMLGSLYLVHLFFDFQTIPSYD